MKSWVKIYPGWVDLLDEFDLLLSGPVFELFFACDGAAHILEIFEVDEAMDGVMAGVGFGNFFAVRGDPTD